MLKIVTACFSAWGYEEPEKMARIRMRGFMAEHVVRTLFYRCVGGGEKTDARVYYPEPYEDGRGVDCWVDFRPMGEDAPDWLVGKILAVQVKGIALSPGGVENNPIIFPTELDESGNYLVPSFLMAVDNYQNPDSVKKRIGQEIIPSMTKCAKYVAKSPETLSALIVLPTNPDSGYIFPESWAAANRFYDVLFSPGTFNYDNLAA